MSPAALMLRGVVTVGWGLLLWAAVSRIVPPASAPRTAGLLLLWRGLLLLRALAIVAMLLGTWLVVLGAGVGLLRLLGTVLG
jgi:hypothetical protein